MTQRETGHFRDSSPAQIIAEAAGDRYWQTAAILLIGVILAAGVLWASRHATGIDWDEAGYINRAIQDRYIFQKEGLYGLVRTVGCHEPQRPPAYRMMVIPITIPFGVSAPVTRYVSIFVFAMTLWIVYLLGRRLAGPACGAFTSLLLATSPGVLICGVKFGTEPTLYLSVAGSLYFLVRRMQPGQRSVLNVLGLGSFLGLGLLSKTSFVTLAAPMMAMAFVLAWWKKVPGLRPAFLVKACLVGGLLAFPWWQRSWREALAYTQYSSAFTRHSVEGTLFHMVTGWFFAFAREGVGIVLLLLIGAILARAIVSPRRLGRMEPYQRGGLWICLAAAIPLILLQITGKNHNMRLITPSFFPLAVAVGLVASTTSWTRSRWLTGLATALLALQTAVVAAPSFMGVPIRETDPAPAAKLTTRASWDWDVLWTLCKGRGLTDPVIEYLGNGPPCCVPQISYPWVRRDQAATVTWLWRYEQGDIDWDGIRTKLGEADAVITALDYRGVIADKQHLDNAHNGELAALLENDRRFEGPLEIDVGARPPAKIVVFFRLHQGSATK